MAFPQKAALNRPSVFAYPESHARLDSIDQFRGLAILLMVIANYLGSVRTVPAWLHHAPDIGLTVIDLIAPFFIFAIGLTYGRSFQRRLERDGREKTIGHFLSRSLALIGIGALLSAGEKLFGADGGKISWGVLQAIGAASLLALPLLHLKASYRAAIGVGLLAGFQLLLDLFWKETVLASSHGGLFGALGWAAMLILATALADLYYLNRPRIGRFAAAGGLALAAGIGLAFLSPISKNRVSASYVLVSLGASALIFTIFHMLRGKTSLRTPVLSAWGQNPLLLYLLHFILLGIFFLPGVPAWYEQAAGWLVILQSLFLIVVMTLIALYLDRKNILISL